MKKSFISVASLILSLALFICALVSCDTPEENSNETQIKTNTETETIANTDDTSTLETEIETTTEFGDSSETESDTEEPVISLIDGEYSDLIENANSLKNGVQAHFTNANHDYFVLENTEMELSYALSSDLLQQVAYLKNSKGVSYVENTMDVFVRMKDGNTYFASGSSAEAVPNLYRIGMYYYEARFEDQDFFNSPELIIGEPYEDWAINKTRSNNVNVNDDGTVTIANASDPYIVLENINYSAETYNLLKIKLRAVSGTRGNCQMFVIAGSHTTFNPDQTYSFKFPTTGEYFEIMIPMYKIADFGKSVTGLRFDIDGNVGDSYEIVEITPSRLDIAKSAPINLGLCRSFYIYSDKMHHRIQISAKELTKNIDVVGMHTIIEADRVAKLIAKDAKGTHTSLDGVDWSSAEYVGFDIKDAGIFGYILPQHETAGNLNVTLKDGNYIIEQTRQPQKGVIKVSKEGSENAEDFYVSQRIYTDERHSFTEFIKEAEIERNPLNDLITLTPNDTAVSSVVGYDPVRGIYTLKFDGPGGFGGPYYLYQNRYYTIDMTVNCPDDRDIYIMAVGNSAALECAVIVSDKNILLPIPVSVCKNFSESNGERNLYNLDDTPYSEAFFPMTLKSGDKYNVKLVNIYQNWGQYPLKQISSIQFRAPYYHLSTGVTESNCILPWYSIKVDGNWNTLPDFRAMSAPLWESQPQHNSGGAHMWLEYTDSDGNHMDRTENYGDYIDSYGPTYADVTMHNISTDGRIKATYTHLEMPQTDENRTYYEIKYEVLEDIHIKDFKNDFSIYSVTDNEPAATADYRKIGYLNMNNECVVTDSNLTKDSVKEYILGDNCPYFSMFDMPADASPDGYTNVAFLIYQSDIVIGGEKNDANFVILNSYNKIDLSLDLGEVTLKAGDSFTINAILIPWGSHESDYSDGDVNVRAVRENSLLNPIKITSETDEIIESVYLPKVKSADGKTATFTVKGGYNNVAIRAYGFEKLTVPTLYQLIDGNWEKVELSSSQTPDKSGYYHYYDGYMVHYDGNGTYSYSFVTDFELGEEKTFKIDLSNDVTSLPDSGKSEPVDYLDIYYNANEIENCINASGNSAPLFSKIVVSEDASYVSLYANNKPESFMIIGRDPEQTSGQYFVVKYRIPQTNKTKFNNFEFYYSSTTPQPVSGENIKYSNLKQDGKWHVVVIDASSFNHKTFSPNADGKYDISYLRFDILNTPSLTEDNYIDLAFFGMCDTLEEVCDITKAEFDKIDYVTGKGEVALLTETCTPFVKVYIDPESGYTESSLAYFGVVDNFAGDSINAGGNFVEGIMLKTDFNISVPTKISVGGWATVEGGVHKYVWSADGGLTWNEPVSATLGTASDSYVNHAKGKLTTALGESFSFNDVEATKKNATFQTPKLSLDLSEYSGQTVDFTFAAIPASDTDSLCLILCIEGLTIE